MWQIINELQSIKKMFFIPVYTYKEIECQKNVIEIAHPIFWIHPIAYKKIL